ncbi:MAG: DUF2793 domain-containing protein [Parvularculaceae bacterium]|nr:DUF2793 domain-containing protein [Parvularculaceae bacterium]
MSKSPRLGLSYILPQQAQKHVTANHSFRRLDALVQLGVASASLASEPAAPAEGDSYILPSAPAGAAWSSFAANAVAAFQDGEWIELTPRAGWRAYARDIAAFVVFDGAAWTVETGGGSGGSSGSSAPIFGVNATADTTNRLTVKSDASLLSHDDVTPGSGDARQIVNKASAAKTASVLFQTNSSGRAEFGLNGVDDFSLKVSSDGAAWTDAVYIDRLTGNVGVGVTNPALKFVVDNGSMSIANGSSNCYLSFGSSNFSTGYIAWVPSANRIALWSVPAGGEIRLGTENTARMTVAADGKVGIGTTVPASKLDVDGTIRVKTYAKAALPSASPAGQMLYVSDEAGGAVIAFSDGTNWRRTTDRAVVS